MATNQRTSFERSLDLFRRELSDDQIKQINGANQKIVTDTIQEIQGRLGRRNDLCKLTRIQRFLHAMEHIEKLVTIFLNASDFVAFIWGPIKLALMVATTWTDAIRQLIDAYEEIAEALGNLAFFQNLIQSRDDLRLVLADYFSDILQLHHCVLGVFSRPEWKRLFKWAWGSFRREVKTILESLKRKQALLSDDKLQSHAILKEVQDSGQYAKDQFGNLQTSLEDIRSTLASEQLQSKALQAQEMKTYLESRLNVSKSRTDLDLESRDPVYENSGVWIFSSPTFKRWEEGKSAENRVLFLNGSPGSGKSTLAKTIIRHQRQKEVSEAPGRSFLAYFFFKHNATERRTARSMLQHVIMQLVDADETIMRLAHDTLSTKDVTELADLKELATDCFTSRPNATLVLDGLDEAMSNEQEISIKWCLDRLVPAARTSGCHLKILICGQRDGKLDCVLSSHPQIRLDLVDAHQSDIEQFTKEQAAKIRTRFRLAAQEEQTLVSKIAGSSRGMFLYARVVLDNLAAMDSKRDFKDELESDAFPKDLNQAYDRITQRVLQNNRPSRDTSVKRILGWIICAAKPLRWREIQSRFCIDAEKQICDLDNMRLDSCKRICSSLVDVTNCDMFPNIESEQFISIVHETATRYLIDNRTVNLLEEHIDMALFCCRYLSSRPFTTSKSQDITADIHSGYFGFLDYAAAHYDTHVQEVEALEVLTNSAPKLEAVKTAAVDLEKAHCKESAVEAEDIDRAAQDLILAIQDSVLVVRTLIDLEREKPGTAAFDLTEGPMRHRCHKIQCSKFATGLSDKTALEQHLAVHDRPFRCPHADCFGHKIGHASQKQLESHDKTFHRTTTGVNATFPSVSRNDAWNPYEACKAGDLDEVKRFHREGANLEGRKANPVTPLCAAASAGHGHVCKYLVDNGIDPFHYKRDARSLQNPITRVINGPHLDILEFFLHNGNGPNDSNLAESIARAICADNPAALSMILNIRQPIYHADVIKLVPHKVLAQYPWNWKGARRATHSVDATLMHAWFQYVRPEFYNEKAVFIAQSDCAEYKIWGDMFFRQLGCFRTALGKGCYSLAIFLMDIGNDEYLQIEDENGATPLHLCIKRLCVEDCSSCFSMVWRLLRYGGGKFSNITDSNGNIPANLALSRGLPQAVLRAILDNTADINYRNNSGGSLLHAAKSVNSIRVLLENKSVDLSSRNYQGQTAFSSAIGRGRHVDEDVLGYLFEADPSLAWTPDKSEGGLMPLHHALKRLDEFHSYQREWAASVASFLLKCSEAKRILVEYQAKSTDADRRKVRDFAVERNLQKTLEIMDSIGFNTI
ncbi:heterokaryon incompatibility protein het-E-1 [Fusarium subglutinans]|uniref:Heterokaryon incompatibility protein het-E-1 n=1 Tax=Gibberella subglutinans TaxID=42677 RepID=A0A8H5LBF6_GIBSU|nr:heterokaryon incompatibility protein het-E-1 [Fusarium subglutinans]KAF5588538.1 heterokaryon incompatibility protein het-E-1 [Fusarium subglutinans]